MDQEKGKESKTRKHRIPGKECAAAECSSFEYNSDGGVSGLHLNFLNSAKVRCCNLIKGQHRHGLRVYVNTILCENHFRRHEIIKGKHSFSLVIVAL